MGFQTEPLEDIILDLTKKNNKLKELILLTDDSVSDIVVGDTQLKQWNSYLSEFPDEGRVK